MNTQSHRTKPESKDSVLRTVNPREQTTLGDRQTKVRVLWATKKGEPDYCEELITEVAERIPAARKWAKANGYDRFREADVDLGVKPNFAATLNLSPSKAASTATERKQ